MSENNPEAPAYSEQTLLNWRLAWLRNVRPIGPLTEEQEDWWKAFKKHVPQTEKG